MKLKTKVKRFYKRNTMLSLGLAAAGAYVLYTRSGMSMPALAPAPVKAQTAMAPTTRYAYDAYPPIRNEPYYDSTHFFGPADGDPVFYGF
tara:strand:- start:1327 stop:1596 length:270 start_codon:yes stop_codon:yes gene_type:complete